MARQYFTGTVARTKAHGSKTIMVYCLGPDRAPKCTYMAKLNISDLPEVTWQEISDRLRCPTCGTKGRVEIRFDHQETSTGERACNIIDGKIIP